MTDPVPSKLTVKTPCCGRKVHLPFYQYATNLVTRTCPKCRRRYRIIIRPIRADAPIRWVHSATWQRIWSNSEEQAEKDQRITGQFPKKCGCGAVYPDRKAWKKLEFHTAFTDAYADQEWRHCVCGSTLAILTKIHDLAAE